MAVFLFMENFVFIKSVLAVSSLLFLSSIIAAYVKKLRIPYTVVLVVVGIFLSLLAKNVDAFSFLNVLELSPELVFYIFLPVLIFESAYNIKTLELKENAITISTLAIVSLIISAFTVGILLSFLFPAVGIEFPFMVALLFGALISATDPIAVLALFKELGVPRRLTVIFEGESLFNDGTAVVLFQIILALVLAGSGSPILSTINGIGEFFYVVIMAMVFGSLLGFIFSWILGMIKNMFTVEITLTLILAHVTFIVADHFLHVSGIIATVFAGLVVGNYGRSKISVPVREIMEHFWTYGAFVVNSMIFLLIGLSIKGMNVSHFILATVIGIGVVMFARAISVFAVFPFLHKFTKEEKTPLAWQGLLAWGSLRGALALSIVLLLPDDFEYKSFMLTLTLSMIIFTLVIKATSIKKIIQRLGVDKSSDEENFEMAEGFVFVDETVRTRLREMHNSGAISDKIYEKLDKKYTDLENSSKEKIMSMMKNKEGAFSHDEMLSILKRQALGIEKRILFSLFADFDISETTYNKINAKLDVQINRLRKGQPQISGGEDRASIFEKAIREIVNYFKKNDMFEGVVEKYEVSNIITRYRMLRARTMISREVISQLERMREKKAIYDEDALNKVISQYKSFEESNIRQMKDMKEKYSELAEVVEYAIANNASICLEKSIVHDLRENGIISENICNVVTEYLDELLNKKRKIAKRFFKKRNATNYNKG